MLTNGIYLFFNYLKNYFYYFDSRFIFRAKTFKQNFFSTPHYNSKIINAKKGFGFITEAFTNSDLF